MGAQKRGLNIYRSRRNLKSSPEPYGGKKKRSKIPIFVIQKHDARNLHYDFRIEIDGVLVSWAIPKGPSTDPRVKRLAMPTDDHPLEYARFEGVIPEGSYGAGPVLVWDKGTYKNIKKIKGKIVSMRRCHKRGTIEVFLRGKKLYGAYALIRTKNDRWLLIKMRDEYADARRNPVNSQPKSVLTGRTIAQVRRDAKAKE